MALKDRRRHSRVAGRWLLRYLEEREGATLEEAALIVACLGSLTGYGKEEALQTLRVMAERATSRRRTSPM